MAKLGTSGYGKSLLDHFEAMSRLPVPDPTLAGRAGPDVCPTCGHRAKPQPMTAAERQKRYRERKRAANVQAGTQLEVTDETVNAGVRAYEAWEASDDYDARNLVRQIILLADAEHATEAAQA